MRIMDGHSNFVESVAFSPDGTRIVSGSVDNTLRMWDAVSGAHLNTLEGHSDRVESVAFSPDGTRIVSGSWDKTLRMWDAVSGAHLNTLKGHSGSVSSLAFSPDGTRIVSGSRDLRIWDAVSGAHLNTLEGHPGHIPFVAFSLNGMPIVSDRTSRVWDTVSDAQVDHMRAANSVSSFPYYDRQDKWICSIKPKRRLCWLPVSCRPRQYSSSGNRVGLGTEGGLVVIVDLSGVESYLDAL